MSQSPLHLILMSPIPDDLEPSVGNLLSSLFSLLHPQILLDMIFLYQLWITRQSGALLVIADYSIIYYVHCSTLLLYDQCCIWM